LQVDEVRIQIFQSHEIMEIWVKNYTLTLKPVLMFVYGMVKSLSIEILPISNVFDW